MNKKGFIVLFSSTAIALYGYDQGMMSLVNTNQDYLKTMNLAEESPIVGLIVSIYYLAAACGAVLFSKIADQKGRKVSIYWSLICTIIGDLLMFVSGLGYLKHVSPITTMFIGRLVLGLGVGGIDTVIPVYSSELSSDDARGRALAQEFQANILGLNIAYAINLALTVTLGKYSEWAWRVPIVCMQFFPLALVSVLHQLPESPRWFIFHDRHDDAKASLDQIYDSSDAKQKLDELQEAAEDESSSNITYAHMLNPKDPSFHPTVVTVMGQVNQAATGIGAISVYGSQLFVLLGRSKTVAEYLTMGNYVTYLVMMTLAWLLIDKYGRRKLMVSGAFGMTLMFALLTATSSVKQYATSIVGIVLLYAITSTFGVTWLATPMLIPTEIFPLTARAQGSAISIITWGISNFGVTLLTPILFNNVKYWLFAVFAVTNLFAGWWTRKYVPETGGRSFELNQDFFKAARETGSWAVADVDSKFLSMPKTDEEEPLL